ncbi:Dihydrolipoamide acetyltransferase component of pyruvate dehydrogenase complex, partial [hydrothermal vent metagenome]
MSEMVEVKVPDIGDFESVEIIEVLISVGDQIAEEDSLITVESDKASMEIPSSHAGTVKEVKVSVGESISEGAVVVIIETSSQAAVPAKEVQPETAEKVDVVREEAPAYQKAAEKPAPARAVQNRPLLT